MSSLRQIGRVALLSALLMAPASVAVSQSTQGPPAIIIRESDEGVRVTASGGPIPSARVMRLSNPDRLVLDFDRATLGASTAELQQWRARGIRMAYHAEDGSTRVVFDIPAGQQRWMRYDQNSLVVEFRSLLAKGAGEPMPQPIVTAPRVARVPKQEPRLSAATKPPVQAPRQSLAAAMPRVIPPQVQQTAPPAGNTETVQAQPNNSEPDTLLQVTSRDGLLQVSARGVPFKRILNEVANASGASVQMLTPEEGNQNEVFEYGPAPALDVIRRLFEGSEFNYLVISEPNSTTRISRIVVTSKLTYSMGNDGLVSDDDTNPDKLKSITPLPKEPVEKRPD